MDDLIVDDFEICTREIDKVRKEPNTDEMQA